MRFSIVLLKQHIGRGFKFQWKLRSTRKIENTGAREYLESVGIPVVDVNEIIQIKANESPSVVEKHEIPDGCIDDSLLPRKFSRDSSHPDWHNDPCRIYHDHTILLGGLDQALNLTKTYLIERQLPAKITDKKIKVENKIHDKVCSALLNAHVLDAIQLKLPKAVDIKKPGWNYPREYGIPKWRRNASLWMKLSHICDAHLAEKGFNLLPTQYTNEIQVRTPLRVNGENILFDVQVSQLLSSKTPLGPYADTQTTNEILSQISLPSIYPLNPTISIFPQNIYKLGPIFSVKKNAPYPHVNLAVINLNMPFIKHNKSQMYARTLLHAFGVAGGYAKQRFGETVKELPEPITINCIHTDSQNFIFGALQLNSLDLDGDSGQAKNLLWLGEIMPIFEECQYKDSKPSLTGYNPEVIETLLAVYQSQLTG